MYLGCTVKTKLGQELATLLIIHDYYELIHRQTIFLYKCQFLLVDIIHTSDEPCRTLLKPE